MEHLLGSSNGGRQRDDAVPGLLSSESSADPFDTDHDLVGRNSQGTLDKVLHGCWILTIVTNK